MAAPAARSRAPAKQPPMWRDVTPPPAPPPPSAGPAGPAAAPPPGPWYTCGLGGGLLATNAVVFGLVVALTYVVGLYVVTLLVGLLFALLCGITCNACSTSASGSCNSCNSSCSGCGNACSGCGDGCSSCGNACSCKSSAVLGSVMATGTQRQHHTASLADALAHHPDHPAFRQDVFRIASWRLCVGCFTTYPVFLALSTLLALLPLGAWWWGLAAGLPLAAAQAVSSLGWARLRAVKVVVKAALGAGLALATAGILQSPWPRPLRVAVLLGLLGLATLSALPRRRRLEAWAASAESKSSR